MIGHLAVLGLVVVMAVTTIVRRPLRRQAAWLAPTWGLGVAGVALGLVADLETGPTWVSGVLAPLLVAGYTLAVLRPRVVAEANPVLAPTTRVPVS